MHAAQHVRKDGCDALCSWVLHHAVSLHVGARFLPSLERAAEVMRSTALMHAQAMELLLLLAAARNGSHFEWP